MKQRSFLLIVLSVFCMHMMAQQPDSAHVLSLDEIVIQSGRIQIPFARQNRTVIVIDEADIQKLPVRSVSDLLFYVAGIDVRQRGPRGTQADIRIDGGTFDQTLVLLNGMRVTDPQTGHNMMNLPVSMLAVKRIEIVKGAAARIYGINALNGAVNIITAQPNYNTAEVHVYAGSSFQRDTSNGKLFGETGIEGMASIVGKSARHMLSASHAQSSGYRYNTAFRNEKLFYQNTIDIKNDISLHTMAGYVYNDFGANAFYAAPGDKESREIVQTAIGSVKAEVPLRTWWTFRPALHYRYNQDDYIYIRQKPSVYRNIHETNVWNLELNNSFTTVAGEFGLGIEARREAIQSNTLGDRSRENVGFFGEYSFSRIEKVLIQAGAYVNYNSMFGWKVLPGIDAGWSIAKGWRIYGSAGTGQRLPTFTDLYYKGPSNIGNASLMPEQSVYAEVGMKYTAPGFHSSLSYFSRHISEFIDWTKQELTDPWQPANYQRIHTKGISFLSDYQFDPSLLPARVSLASSLSYTWLHAAMDNDVSSGTYSQYALDHLRQQGSLRWKIGYGHLGLSAGMKYNQRINKDQYLLLDARLSASYKWMEWYAESTNLTNKTYLEAGAVPLAGRWFAIGMKWQGRKKE